MHPQPPPPSRRWGSSLGRTPGASTVSPLLCSVRFRQEGFHTDDVHTTGGTAAATERAQPGPACTAASSPRATGDRNRGRGPASPPRDTIPTILRPSRQKSPLSTGETRPSRCLHKESQCLPLPSASTSGTRAPRGSCVKNTPKHLVGRGRCEGAWGLRRLSLRLLISAQLTVSRFASCVWSRLAILSLSLKINKLKCKQN